MRRDDSTTFQKWLGAVKASLFHPVLAVGAVVIAMLWTLAHFQNENERANYRIESVQEVGRMAVLLEQNVYRVANELDRILEFIRQGRERAGTEVDWASIIANKFTLHEQLVLITIVDRNGTVIASTRELRPSTLVNISDRDHFRYNVYSSIDALYISRPVIGRVSGTKSVQFTRRLTGPGGEFEGIIVASLDPEQFVRSLTGVVPGDQGGFAVRGFDGTVLVSTGSVGQRSASVMSGQYLRDGTTVYHGDNADGPYAMAERAVKGMPLTVEVFSQDRATNAERQTDLGRRATIALVLMLLVAIASIALALILTHRRNQVGFLAHFDALTGLANRSQFREFFSRRLRRIGAEPSIALHLIDLDGFKQVNDTYGHPMGDKLLIEVGHRLRKSVRATDFVARLGGDEFAIVQIGATSNEDASALASRICEVIKEPFVIDGICASVGSSIGIQLVTTPIDRPDETISQVDLALYAAKAAGRGQWKFYEAGMKEAADARAMLEADLRQAIERREFELHYQPIVTIGSGMAAGYEALVRWRHPTRGVVPPLEFIPLAEETKLIVPIGEWVLQQACIDMAQCPEHLKVAVNISPVQFESNTVVQAIRTALQRSGLAPHRLEIEITESTLMRTTDATLKTLDEISALGIKIAMDDFGTGYSSLSYLQKFPISCIKIDRSFVNELGQADGRGNLVRAIANLATSMGMTTIAEGVETGEQLRQLQTLGCTEAQGYLFSKPMRAVDILPPNAPKDTLMAVAA